MEKLGCGEAGLWGSWVVEKVGCGEAGLWRSWIVEKLKKKVRERRRVHTKELLH